MKNSIYNIYNDIYNNKYAYIYIYIYIYITHTYSQYFLFFTGASSV